MKAKRAVIYARFSSHNQTEQSIEGQVRVCKEWCANKGYTVIDVYADRAISGKNADNRPEFQRLIADSERRIFDAVVVYKTDRFARNKYDSAVYKRQLKKNNVSIHYAAEAIPDGPEGIILESLMEGLAEYYSAELSQKIKRGMHESALKGRSTGSGRALGYKVNEDKSFSIDPEGAKAVETIFDMYIKGESKADICDYLNKLGYKTVQGNAFNKNSIDRIIKNEKYIGVYKYADVVIKDGMPAIVSEETFNLAQRELARRTTRKTPREPKAEYLLAGKLFCGHCKQAMVGVSGTSKTGRKFYYYYCPSARAKTGCDKKQVRREYIEDLVVEMTIKHILKE
ncbi:MAG: recombinase family protein, partial [Clostridia bacterium]|nr:recombinase family protein [Clostridia bacterium]